MTIGIIIYINLMRKSPKYEDKKITFIPYYSWANRKAGEMRVWINKEI